MGIVAFFGRGALPLSVTVSPTSISETFANSPSSNTPTTRDIITATVGASASGGAPPYSFSWARLSGSSLIAAQNPSGSSTNFLASSVPINTAVSAVFRVTVTDAASSTATFDVTVSAEYLSGS